MNASTETSVKHSPGPWRLTGEIDRIHGGEVIRPTRGDGVDSPVAVVCDFNRLDRDAEREANARLMAASPDLLETAEAFLAWFRENAGHFTIGGDDELKRGFEDRARALATACHDATEGRQP